MDEDTPVEISGNRRTTITLVIKPFEYLAGKLLFEGINPNFINGKGVEFTCDFEISHYVKTYLGIDFEAYLTTERLKKIDVIKYSVSGLQPLIGEELTEMLKEKAKLDPFRFKVFLEKMASDFTAFRGLRDTSVFLHLQ